jgi:hypothetical protein
VNDVMSDLPRFRGHTFRTKLKCPAWIDHGECRCGEAVQATVYWSHDDDTELVTLAPTCKAGHALDRVEDRDDLSEQVREGSFASPLLPSFATE